MDSEQRSEEVSDGARDEIANAMNRINEEHLRDAVSEQYQRAKAIVATIPSGTRDEDLTPEQANALDEYEQAIAILTSLPT